jgi:hypothetical protein
METIFSTVPGMPVAPAPAEEKDRKSAGLAFLLSLLLPGAGHIYCGKARNGLVTLVAFAGAVCLALTLPASNLFWGVGLRAAVVLYMFAFCDAFYVAREINNGLDPYMIGNNPRIAAMLNLLTNGFGYFYVGERKKGIIVFLVLRVFSGAFGIQTSEVRSGGLAVLELVFVFLAVDAYRIARKQLRESFPSESLDDFATPQTGGLSAAVPIALGCFFLLNYSLLVLVGLAMPDYSKIDQTRSKVEKTSSGSVYFNATYDLRMPVPAGWEFGGEPKGFIVRASTLEGACSVAIIPEPRLPFGSLPSHARDFLAELKKQNPGYQFQSERPSQLGTRPAHELLVTARFGEIEVHQRYVFAHHGLTRYTFIGTAATGLLDECGTDMQKIQSELVF